MKFAGMIGFEIYEENPPGSGKWEPRIVEKFYRGTMEQELRRLYSGEDRNKDINIDNRIRIVANPFAQENYAQMKFAEHMGACWEIKTVDVRCYPHMYLYLGGVYNGPRAEASNPSQETVGD